MSRFFLLPLLAFLTALAAASPVQAQAAAERRVALVIGNAAYREAPLKNPANDARAMALRLRSLGFEVVLRVDAPRAAMAEAVGEFARRLQPGGVALIFYAGHGMQVRGRNYLLPVDVTLATETDLRFQAVDIGTLTEELEQTQSRVSFVILDACRNNPFERRLRGAARGLAAVDAARGSLIAYATAPGSVAADGEGANGTYTAALLRALALPNLKAEEVFKRVRIEVAQVTNNQQIPWESSSLTGDFVFNVVAGQTPTAAPAPTPAVDREVVFWQSIQASKRASDYEAYLQRYPQGEFAPLAQARLAELQRPAPSAPPQSAPPQAAPQSAPAQSPPPQVAVAPTPPPQVPVGGLIGCFKDKGSLFGLQGRDLDGWRHNSQRMTAAMCIQECAKRGFAYAGTQFRTVCFCGNRYGSAGAATNCSMPCAGNEKETCGGSWANTVYRAK